MHGELRAEKRGRTNPGEKIMWICSNCSDETVFLAGTAKGAVMMRENLTNVKILREGGPQLAYLDVQPRLPMCVLSPVGPTA
jgi:hypothetical protein